jgi:hypothetical protein
MTSVRSPNVQIIAAPVPFSGSARRWASTGTSTPNSGLVTVGAEQRLVALVVGVGDQGHAADDQLGAGGLTHHVARAVRQVERQVVVGAGAGAVLQLGLGHRHAERDVPHRRGIGLVGLAAGQVVEEGPLTHTAAALVDRRVRLVPVDRQAQAAPQRFEDLFVLAGQLHAQFDEVAAADRHKVPSVLGRLLRRDEARVVGTVGSQRTP